MKVYRGKQGQTNKHDYVASLGGCMICMNETLQ